MPNYPIGYQYSIGYSNGYPIGRVRCDFHCPGESNPYTVRTNLKKTDGDGTLWYQSSWAGPRAGPWAGRWAGPGAGPWAGPRAGPRPGTWAVPWAYTTQLPVARCTRQLRRVDEIDMGCRRAGVSRSKCIISSQSRTSFLIKLIIGRTTR